MLSFLPGILESDPCIQILMEYSEFLCQNIEIIYNHIQSLVQVKVSQFFLVAQLLFNKGMSVTRVRGSTRIGCLLDVT